MTTADESWDEMIRRYPDAPVTAALLRKGAASLTHHLWRNTEVIEHWAHAEGQWHDCDMMRVSTRATYHALEALRAVRAGEVTGVDAFDQLCEDWLDLMPTAELHERFLDDEHIGTGLEIWGEAVDDHGLGRALTCLTENMFWAAPFDWWLMPTYAEHVAELAQLDPPDPSTFTERMRHHPWDLSDEQAQFVVDHRYRSARQERRDTPDE